jgi:hypothetical protein
MLGFSLAFLVLVFCVAMLIITGGVRDSLSNSRIGGIYNFFYLQPLSGTNHRYFVKVLNVRKLDKEDIDSLNCFSMYRRYDDIFYRTSTLVTCEMEDGSIRNFYGERATNCQRLNTPIMWYLKRFFAVSPLPVRV